MLHLLQGTAVKASFRFLNWVFQDRDLGLGQRSVLKSTVIIVLQKVAIEVSNTQEMLKILDGGWFWPALYC